MMQQVFTKRCFLFDFSPADLFHNMALLPETDVWSLPFPFIHCQQSHHPGIVDKKDGETKSVKHVNLCDLEK